MKSKKDTDPVTSSSLEHDPLTLQDNIDLWKYFESIGGGDKDRMITIVTWLLAFATALLAYIATKDIDLTRLKVKNPREAIAFAVLGLFICAISGYVIYALAEHADRNWERASIYRTKIPGLSELFPKASESKFPLIFRVFFGFVASLLLCFVIVIICSLMYPCTGC
jgi:amino acid transporter